MNHTYTHIAIVEEVVSTAQSQLHKKNYQIVWSCDFDVAQSTNYKRTSNSNLVVSLLAKSPNCKDIRVSYICELEKKTTTFDRYSIQVDLHLIFAQIQTIHHYD